MGRYISLNISRISPGTLGAPFSFGNAKNNPQDPHFPPSTSLKQDYGRPHLARKGPHRKFLIQRIISPTRIASRWPGVFIETVFFLFFVFICFIFLFLRGGDSSLSLCPLNSFVLVVFRESCVFIIIIYRFWFRFPWAINWFSSVKVRSRENLGLFSAKFTFLIQRHFSEPPLDEIAPFQIHLLTKQHLLQIHYLCKRNLPKFNSWENFTFSNSSLDDKTPPSQIHLLMTKHHVHKFISWYIGTFSNSLLDKTAPLFISWRNGTFINSPLEKWHLYKLLSWENGIF